MQLAASVFALSAALTGVVAAPNAKLEERAIATGTCNRDNLYRSFVDPRYSSSASAFCSTYVRSTVSTVATTTVTTTSRATVVAKRDLPATTAFPASRLSSACSCILTASPSPTTVYTSTRTVTVIATPTSPPSTCKDVLPIVKNGDFETGALGPWSVLNVIPPYPDYAQYESFNVTQPGYKSKYAFTVTDDAASSYFELDLGQDVVLCPGTKYNFAAKVFITDDHNIPTKETYLTLNIDDTQVASAPFSYDVGPPIVWKDLSGTFTASKTSQTVKVKFIATNIVGVQYGVDNVVVTPVA